MLSQVGSAERGVVTPAVEMELRENFFGSPRAMNPSELRYYLLYWDRIILAESRVVGFALNEEQSLLEQAGILERRQATQDLENAAYFSQELGEMHFEALAKVASEVPLR